MTVKCLREKIVCHRMVIHIIIKILCVSDDLEVMTSYTFNRLSTMYLVMDTYQSKEIILGVPLAPSPPKSYIL